MTDKPDETKACPHGQWNTDYERLVYTCPLCGAVLPFDEREVLIEKGLREREREIERKKPGILGLFGALGLPTENDNGHELWCFCAECDAQREIRLREIQKRRRNGEKPQTLLEIMAFVRSKREKH